MRKIQVRGGTRCLGEVSIPSLQITINWLWTLFSSCTLLHYDILTQFSILTALIRFIMILFYIRQWHEHIEWSDIVCGQDCQVYCIYDTHPKYQQISHCQQLLLLRMNIIIKLNNWNITQHSVTPCRRQYLNQRHWPLVNDGYRLGICVSGCKPPILINSPGTHYTD